MRLCVPKAPGAYRAASRPAANSLQVTRRTVTLTFAMHGGHERSRTQRSHSSMSRRRWAISKGCSKRSVRVKETHHARQVHNPCARVCAHSLTHSANATAGDDGVAERAHLRRQGRRAFRTVACARPREQDRADLVDADPHRPARGHRPHRRRRTHADARADRHALARDARAADARSGDGGGHRLHQPGGRRRGDGHADARVHHRSRPGRAGVRAQARHRRGHRRRPAHLPVRRRDHGHQRPRRLPPAVRIAAHPRRPADAHGADSAPAWSPTVRTRCACACASSSCWARRRSS